MDRMAVWSSQEAHGHLKRRKRSAAQVGETFSHTSLKDRPLLKGSKEKWRLQFSTTQTGRRRRRRGEMTLKSSFFSEGRSREVCRDLYIYIYIGLEWFRKDDWARIAVVIAGEVSQGLEYRWTPYIYWKAYETVSLNPSTEALCLITHPVSPRCIGVLQECWWENEGKCNAVNVPLKLLFLTHQVAGIKGMFLANRKLDNQVKTYITYNRGRDWRLLLAPSQDLKGNNIHCVLVSISQHAAFTLLRMHTLPSKRSLDRKWTFPVVVGNFARKEECLSKHSEAAPPKGRL